MRWGVLLDNNRLDPNHAVSEDKSGSVVCLVMASLSFFPGESSTKALDVAATLRKAQDQGKCSARRSGLPSLPVVLPEARGESKASGVSLALLD